MPFQKGQKIRLGMKQSEETKKKLREYMLNFGNKLPRRRFGRKHSEETKEKMSKSHMGLNTWMKGKKLSKETRKKISFATKGEKNYWWKGGITPINTTIRQSLEYRLWREAVFKRDNWTCQWCKQRGGKIHADHIKMFSIYPELRFSVENGRTLCKKCHAWKTKMDMKIYTGKVPELNYA